MRILFITSTRIGDAVLSTGLLDHLIRQHPGAKVVVACGPAAEGVFARMPNRAWTIVLAKRRFRLHWLELWRQVAGTRWDLVVDLRGLAQIQRGEMKAEGLHAADQPLHIAPTGVKTLEIGRAHV